MRKKRIKTNGYQPVDTTNGKIPDPPTTGTNINKPVYKMIARKEEMTQRDRINAMTNEELYEFLTGPEFKVLTRRSTSFRDDFLEWLDSDVESSRILKLIEYTPDGYVNHYFDGYKECIPYANSMPICEAEGEDNVKL